MYHLALLTTLSGMVIRRVVAAIATLVLLAACGADPAPIATATQVATSTAAPVADPVKACATYKASDDALTTATDAWVAEGKPATSANRTALREAWAAQPAAMNEALGYARGSDVQDEIANVVQVVELVHGLQDAGRTVTDQQSDLLGTAMWAADRACAAVK